MCALLQRAFKHDLQSRLWLVTRLKSHLTTHQSHLTTHFPTPHDNTANFSGDLFPDVPVWVPRHRADQLDVGHGLGLHAAIGPDDVGAGAAAPPFTAGLADAPRPADAALVCPQRTTKYPNNK